MTTDPKSIAVGRRREVAARHSIDIRTLDRAIAEGPEVVRGMAADRARAALVELGLETKRAA